jgi:hypothetical protein
MQNRTTQRARLVYRTHPSTTVSHCLHSIIVHSTITFTNARNAHRFVGRVAMGKRDMFLGESVDDMMNANLIRTKIDGNCIPPPDMGLFQDNWDANVAALIKRVGELMHK